VVFNSASLHFKEKKVDKYLDEFHEFLVEDQLRDIEAKISWVKGRMASSMESLRDTLDREIKNLKADEKHVPNSLGILQGNAGQVDILCQEYYQLLEQKSKILRIIRRYEKASQEG
jgi:hypothetical protein